MIFDLLAPPQGLRGGGAKKKCAIAHPIHVSNAHTKFGWILSNGLGGDRVTDGCDCNIPDAFLKKRGDNNFTELFLMMHYQNFTNGSTALISHSQVNNSGQ